MASDGRVRLLVDGPVMDAWPRNHRFIWHERARASSSRHGTGCLEVPHSRTTHSEGCLSLIPNVAQTQRAALAAAGSTAASSRTGPQRPASLPAGAAATASPSSAGSSGLPSGLFWSK